MVDSFYAEEKTPSGSTVNRIADPDTAQDLAGVEAKQGRNAALLREAELKRTHEEGGLTEIQRQNRELMDGLQQKYPDGFIEKTDRKGRRVLVLAQNNVVYSVGMGETPVYTEYGPVLTNIRNKRPDLVNVVDLTKISDVMDTYKDKPWVIQNQAQFPSLPMLDDPDTTVGLSFRAVKLDDDYQLGMLQALNKGAQDFQVELAKQAQAIRQSTTPDKLLGKL